MSPSIRRLSLLCWRSRRIRSCAFASWRLRTCAPPPSSSPGSSRAGRLPPYPRGRCTSARHCTMAACRCATRARQACSAPMKAPTRSGMNGSPSTYPCATLPRRGGLASPCTAGPPALVGSSREITSELVGSSRPCRSDGWGCPCTTTRIGSPPGCTSCASGQAPRQTRSERRPRTCPRTGLRRRCSLSNSRTS